MSLFRDNGVVLHTYRLGEADRIVVLFTEHHGKVRAVAKGVRRTTSKFGLWAQEVSPAPIAINRAMRCMSGYSIVPVYSAANTR